MDVIYLDNAASTWPKPNSVIEAMNNCLSYYGVNPGRGSYQQSNKAAQIITNCRIQLARLFNIKNPNQITFTYNATYALNQAIQGWLKDNDHVITTTIEHNSIRRPLEALKRLKGIEVSYVKPQLDWSWNIKDFEKEIRPNTKLIAVSHVSNLLGSITPIEQLGELAKKYNIPLLVDASQSAGILPIDVQLMNISMLAFPGHKGLYGPQGTGALYVHPNIELEPIIYGGTGSNSETIEQPITWPERLESGTANIVGIAGLLAGVEFISNVGIDQIHSKELHLITLLLEKLQQFQQITVYGPTNTNHRTGVISFNVQGIEATEIGLILDRYYKIAVRTGYHCTPIAHQTAGTFPSGSVRVSLGYFNKEQDIDALIVAMREIISEYN